MPIPIIEEPPERYGECLAVMHAGFGTEVAEFGLTAENTPSNPAFWGPDEVARVVARPTQLFAVEEDGRIVGCAFVGASRQFPATWVLRHLAVHPDARHRGHGEALVAEGLSVRAAEEIVAVGEHGAKRAPRAKHPVELSPAAQALQEQLSDRLDTRVLVSEGRSRGRIVIEFAGSEDLDRIADLLT